MALGWIYQTCPECGRKTRRRVLSKKTIRYEAIEGSKRQWVRGGRWSIAEPTSVYLYTYMVEHQCRRCGHRWTERITRQRPW